MTLVNRLNRRITIQKKSGGKDVGGRPIPVGWVDVAKVWAAWDPLRSREYFTAAAVNAENTARYRVRQRSGITTRMRIIDGGRFFEITGILEDVTGDRTQMHLLCKETIPDG